MIQHNNIMLRVYSYDLYLESETNGENKWSDAGDESGEESVEGEGSDQAAVDKLDHASEEDVGEVGVDDLKLLGGVRAVLLVKLGHDSRQGGHDALLLVLKF